MEKSSEELLTIYRRLRRRLLHLHNKLINQLPKEANRVRRQAVGHYAERRSGACYYG